MQSFLFILLWGVVIAGGLPRSLQQSLDDRVSWWHSHFFGLLSSLLEFACGLGLLRFTLMLSGFGRLSGGNALCLGIVGAFFLIEGIVRVGVTSRMDSLALPSLPVSLVVQAIQAIRKTT